MFGQKSVFGSTGTTQPAFGTAAPTSTFGSTGFGASSFGAAPNVTAPAGGGGLFGAQPAQQQQQGGLFGQQQAATGFGAAATSTGTTGFGSSAFGSGSAFGKPAFGTPSTGGGGGLFGSTSTGQGTSLFGASNTQQSTFGAGTSAFGGGSTAFGSTGAAPNGTTIKFNPLTGQDTMIKSGVTTNISTRHQCITCMKEYESKSLEELRCEDYLAGRKGGSSGTSGGLFGAAPNQTMGSSGGLFGNTQANTQQSGGLFGQQQNKPLFGSTSTSGFGNTAGSSFGGFGSTTTTNTGGGGLFGAKPGGFGTQSTSTGGFGGFGSTTTQSGGGLFGQQQQNKPMGFGTPTTQSGGLFGSSASTFGQTQTPAFGQTTAPFGMQNQQQQQQQGSSIGLFGQQQQNKPTGFGAPFGSAVTSSAAPSFGGFGSTATSTAFGQNKPAFGGFGTQSQPTTQTQSFGFGTGMQQPQQSGGLFGSNQSKPFGFGSTASAQPSTFGGFGTTTSTAGGGGLFGGGGLNQQKPGGLFGGTGTTGFGTGGSSFGTPGQSFGTGSSFGGGSSFGPSNSFGTGTTGAFGGTGGFGTGSTGSTFFSGGNPLQTQQPQQQQLLSQQTQPNVIQQKLVQLAASPYGENPLFKNLVDSSKSEDILKPINPIAQKAVDAQQYTISPHRHIKAKAKPRRSINNKSAIFDGLEDDDVNPKNDLFIPRTSRKQVLNPKSPSTTSLMNGGPSNGDISSLKGRHTMKETDEEEQFSLPTVKSRPNRVAGSTDVIDGSFIGLNAGIKKKNALNSATVTSSTPVSTGEPKTTGVVTPPQPPSLPPSRPLDVTSADETICELSVNEADMTSTEPDNADAENVEPHPAGVVLKRAGYYTIPSLSEIADITDSSGNCLVENFTIGRKGYGNIFFPGVTNVTGINFDETVFIRHKEVIVYPDDEKKPNLGEGLNKKAQVTLDKVFPVDKTNKTSITSPEKLSSMGYEEKLQRACIKLGARFVEYRPETGSWVFKVDHFSKYGLDDSDEEDTPPENDPKKLKTLQLRETAPKRPENKKTVPLSSGEGESDAKKKTGDKNQTTTTVTVHIEDSNLGEDEQSMQLGDLIAQDLAQSRSDTDEDSKSPTLQGFEPKTTSKKVQLMRASLFGDEDDDFMETDIKVAKTRPVILEARPTILERRKDPLPQESMLNKSKGLGGSFSYDQPTPSLGSGILHSKMINQESSLIAIQGPFKRQSGPKLPTYTLQAGYDNFMSLPTPGPSEKTMPVVPQFIGRLRPIEDSLFRNRFKCLADSSQVMKRRFRAGWGNHWTFAACNSATVDFSTVNLNSVQIVSWGQMDQQQLQSLHSWLDLSLEYSIITIDDEDEEDKGIPKIEPKPGREILHAMAEEAKRQVSSDVSAPEHFGEALREAKRIWELCLVLWGRLEEQELFEYGPDSHEVTMLRREAFSEWLEEAVATKMKMDIRDARKRGDAVDEVFALITGRQIEAACAKAQGNGDHFAALLMATGGGHNSMCGQLVFQQLDHWQEMKADDFMGKNRLKLYALLAGVPTWQGSKTEINVCENLDWKRALALHLWFLTSSVSSVSDAFLGYEEAFSKQEFAYAACPKPEYDHESSTSKEIFDIKYHILKLYSNRSHSLESLLNPVTHTSDPLDHRTSWFLHQTLVSLGYSHMSRDKENELHINFASQLESYGQWHWAVYVLAHLQEDQLRKTLIKNILCRNIKLSDHDSLEREAFLCEHLRIPKSWIAEAKAVWARTQKRPKDEAWYLVQARKWSDAHKVIVKKVAPDAIIHNDYEFLHTLLEELARPDVYESILDWNTNGEIFYDFINVDTEVRDLLETRDEDSVKYRIERIRPKITGLCSRIGSLTVECAKERLCQSEIAKKVAHYMRAVLSLEGAAAKPSRILAQHLSQLPLPDDYAMQELKALTRNYIMEIVDAD